jgi:hypothetical protein
MSRPIAYNASGPLSGSIRGGSVNYTIDGAGRDYTTFAGKKWVPSADGAAPIIFVTDSFTRGLTTAGNAYPLFFSCAGTGSAAILYTANRLPGSPGNYSNANVALNDLITARGYFILESNDPFGGIDADSMFLCLDAEQVSSFPQTGVSWYDLSGVNYTVTGTNNPTWNYNNGRSYWQFDGTDDYFAFSSTPPIAQSTYTSTVEIWAKSINNVPTFQVMFGGGVQNINQGYYYGFRQDNANFMYAFYGNDQDGATPRDNRVWNHYVAVYNQATGARYRYFNGELLSPSQASGVAATSAQAFTIGAFNDTTTGPQYFYNGYISKVRGYSKELTQDEIKQNYFQSNIVQNGLIFMVDANNIVSYEGSGTTWYNLTGSSGNALLYNGPTYLPQNGGGIDRDNTDDFISASISISSTTNYSVETWFKANPQTGANYNALISAWNYPIGAGGWELQFYNGVLGVHPTYTVAYTPNTIAHAVYTQNGTETKIYLNGVLQQTSTTSGVTLNNGSIGIGNLSAPGFGGYNLDSTFYNVRLYNKTLTAAEIQQNYQAEQYRFETPTDPVTNGLVLYLDAGNLDSYPGTGTTWYTLAGSNNGTLNNGVGFNQTNGGVLIFDGVDDYATAGNFFTYQAFTIDLWIKPASSQTTYADIIDNNHRGDQNWVLQQNVSNLNEYNFAVFGSASQLSATGNFTLTSNTWVNLTFTYDGDKVRGYNNGTLFATGASLGTTINYVSQTFNIGRWDNGGRNWNGQYSVVQSYNRVLSSTEITQNYNYFKGRFGL